eukprot:2355510-Pyramimonas_sp.AAC.1
MTYTYTQSDSVGFLMSSDFRAVHDDDHACDTAPCRWGSGGMPCKGLVPQKEECVQQIHRTSYHAQPFAAIRSAGRSGGLPANRAPFKIEDAFSGFSPFTQTTMSATQFRFFAKGRRHNEPPKGGGQRDVSAQKAAVDQHVRASSPSAL